MKRVSRERSPFFSQSDKHGKECADVEHNVEEDILFSNAQLFKQKQMPGRRHGQKLGESLNERKYDCVEYFHFLYFVLYFILVFVYNIVLEQNPFRTSWESRGGKGEI